MSDQNKLLIASSVVPKQAKEFGCLHGLYGEVSQVGAVRFKYGGEGGRTW